MAAHHEELLAAAQLLLKREPNQRGQLSSARIRRSISTSYYALFQFLLDEAGLRIAGAHNNQRRRRRLLTRSFTHEGVRKALDKVRGAAVDPSVADFFQPTAAASGRVVPPVFARGMASAFGEAKAKRLDADYNLNEKLSEDDARQAVSRAERAIEAWRLATGAGDKDFKHALSVLMLLQGSLRHDQTRAG